MPLATDDITGRTRVFLVVGDPIAQVQAPQLFNGVFRRHGVDAVLVPARVAPQHLEGFVRHVTAATNIDGLWVTIPHKPAVATIVDRLDAAAAATGSVNAVRRDADGLLHGALFDGTGFVAALRRFGFEPRGRSALLAGCGGSGAAIAQALCEAGVSRLGLHDLGDRAALLASRLAVAAGTAVAVDGTAASAGDGAAASAGGGMAAPVAGPASADPAGYDLVINATPLGLRDGDPLPFDVARIDQGAVVVDILMKHAPTPLLQACRARGIAAHTGFQMLLQQVPDYLEFFGLHDVARAVREDPAGLDDLLAAP